ncbi:MAG: AAA family ATPase [Defluviitaleaceae bacterium]|nr:AAA family ATPase [Defluviitaleaceae bacterium]
MPKTICPTCGVIPLADVAIYNQALRKQTFALSPILPTCNTCGGEVTVKGNPQGAKILLLNGTCGSGKSATAEELVKSHGYLAIDGDCAWQSALYKLGLSKQALNFDSQEIFDEISAEIDILSAIGRKIVLTHVILPKDIDKYQRLFESKGMDYRMVLLKPNYETAVKRTQTRTCFGSVTPEEWVRYFYDRLVFDDMEVFDNSDLDVAQSAAAILQQVNL